MGVSTANSYGRISVSEEAIARIAGNSALECYGIVEIKPQNILKLLSTELFKRKIPKGVKVKTQGDRIFIDLFVVIKYGVSIDAVAQSLRRAVKYDVERFTGMIVDTINVIIKGVKV